ncbi:MAG: hypothetical protein KatS3mg065_0816 [Chloroflexota bacterium]|nr:MAG: hypothetical protein KatS3mg065_0816 [Chloroflexota bacterium]
MVAGSTSRGLAPDRRGSTIVARLSSPDPSPRRDRRRPRSRARAAPRKPPTAGRGDRRRRARAASIARGRASAGASNPLWAGGGADGWPVARGSSPAQIPTMRPSSSSPRISYVFPRRPLADGFEVLPPGEGRDGRAGRMTGRQGSIVPGRPRREAERSDGRDVSRETPQGGPIRPAAAAAGGAAPARRWRRPRRAASPSSVALARTGAACRGGVSRETPQGGPIRPAAAAAGGCGPVRRLRRPRRALSAMSPLADVGHAAPDCCSVSRWCFTGNTSLGVRPSPSRTRAAPYTRRPAQALPVPSRP